MNSLFYLYYRSIINRIKKALHRPVTIIYIIVVIAYVVFMIFSLDKFFVNINISNPTGFVMVLSLFSLLTIPSNIYTYSKKKGLIFRNSDVQFLFPAPFNPKQILIYAQVKQYIIGFIFTLVLVIGGIIWFHISPWRMLLFFVVSFIVENVLEASLMIVLFGNETVPEEGIKRLRLLVKGIVVLLFLFLVYLFFSYNASFEVVRVFLNHPFLQVIPVIGWNIAFIRLLILGPTTLNIICTALYGVLVMVMFLIAKKMKCKGEYFEEAMTFAEDYTEAIKRSKKGEVAFVGKKKKFKKATIEYKGIYAKAIFYRQLLECKKKRFFIFGLPSLICFAAGVGIGFFAHYNNISDYKEFIIPGVGAYITFIFSGYMSKWEKELSNPYTFLLPDSSIRKLWYSTLMEHIRSFVDGCLLTFPGAIMLQLSLVETIMSIVIYMCLQANKLYLNILAEAILGNTLGNIGKQILRMFGQGIIIGLAVIAAILGAVLIDVKMAFILAIIVTVGLTAIVAIGASTLFGKMESIDA